MYFLATFHKCVLTAVRAIYQGCQYNCYKNSSLSTRNI